MSPASKRGAALLTALLIVALMASLSAAVLDDIRFSVRRTTNVERGDQARWYALGVETAARREAARGVPAGELGQWRAWPVEGGQVRARLEDGGACFNLNSVVEGSPGHWLRREGALLQYRTLLGAAGLAPHRALELSETLADWIDSDSGRSMAGAEDDSYAGYRTAGDLLQETSELRAVRGYDDQVYRLIRPYVCALPTAELSPVNVNALSPEKAVLLTALSTGAVSPQAAGQALTDRPAAGWRDADEFLAEPALTGSARAALAGRIGAVSRYYELTVQAQANGAEVLLTSLIEPRGEGPATLRARRWTADE